MQTIIVLLIVALALYFVGCRLYRSFKQDSPGCGCGCGGCAVKNGCDEASRQVNQLPKNEE